jgi:hypothetical protein
MSNVLKVDGKNDGYVLRKQTDPAAWPSVSGRNRRLKLAFNTVGANDFQARIRQQPLIRTLQFLRRSDANASFRRERPVLLMGHRKSKFPLHSFD